eukprot:CAMPEP_0206011024 /NCGR_PEP_ID=MMETSP1464-20131121/12553_1 /ASSEMBLY_ACC=CAM_ASM_001124 /TAXON_ID=119497 /ORGANISM="Exanthemachrysis gayraliae, Strain RCC1523" /LENGTH=104 /DNA_ID=CAMNT_0053384673 /DNA_START=579 /DNA_END=890 /DNA_ORIENTATION=-
MRSCSGMLTLCDDNARPSRLTPTCPPWPGDALTGPPMLVDHPLFFLRLPLVGLGTNFWEGTLVFVDLLTPMIDEGFCCFFFSGRRSATLVSFADFPMAAPSGRG